MRGWVSWGGVRCADGAGAAGVERDQTTPWGNLTIADKMVRADLPLRGGQSTKNASETAAGAGGRSRAPSCCRSHWPGRAARAGDRFPAHRR